MDGYLLLLHAKTKTKTTDWIDLKFVIICKKKNLTYYVPEKSFYIIQAHALSYPIKNIKLFTNTTSKTRSKSITKSTKKTDNKPNQFNRLL